MRWWVERKGFKWINQEQLQQSGRETFCVNEKVRRVTNWFNLCFWEEAGLVVRRSLLLTRRHQKIATVWISVCTCLHLARRSAMCWLLGSRQADMTERFKFETRLQENLYRTILIRPFLKLLRIVNRTYRAFRGWHSVSFIITPRGKYCKMIISYFNKISNANQPSIRRI